MVTTPVEMHPRESLERGSQELLPGISDAMTLAHIVPRLSWKVFYILLSVSRAWRHAIRTHQVYDERVISHSTETLVVWSLFLRDKYRTPRRTITCLSSRREDPTESQRQYLLLLAVSRTRLPPIPYVDGQFVCSDGYIYHLGDVENPCTLLCSKKVFVFDVAGGQTEWKECASMSERRREFGCAAMNGKLYVFGGLSTYMSRNNYTPCTFCGSEVYDPKEDRWSPIKPMTTLRYGHNVHTVGDELFVQGGYCFDPNRFRAIEVEDDDHSADDEDDRADNADGADESDSSSDDEDDDDDNSDDETETWHLEPARSLEVNHPLKNEWRVVNPFGRASNRNYWILNYGRPASLDYLFAVEGKLYSIDWSSIHLYAGENSWTHLHSFAFPLFFGRADRVMGVITTLVVIDGELLIKAGWWNRIRDYGSNSYRAGEFQSKGFRGESIEITWEETNQFLTHDRDYPESSNTVIQL